MDSTHKLLKGYGGTILVAVVVALIIRSFVFEAYHIPTSAMKPTLLSGDTIFVGKWPVVFHRNRLQYGDVIVYSLPGDLEHDHIKRVVGLAGDVVGVRKGRVSLNGNPLAIELDPGSVCGKEDFSMGKSHGVCWDSALIQDYPPTKIPKRSVFVISDLRAKSSDKNGWGIIPVSSIKGRALWVWLSISPGAEDRGSGILPRFRWERMFRRIL